MSRELTGLIDWTEEIPIGPINRDLDAIVRWSDRHFPVREVDLYSARRGGSLIVSPDPWRVAARLGDPQPDYDSLADMLFFPLLPSSPNRSLLAGVSRWRIPAEEPYGRSQDHITLEQGVNALDLAIRTNIREAWAGRQRACVLVTGGLDSAVVAALVTQETGQVPILLAARGGLASPLEIELQDQLARWLGTGLHVLSELPVFTIDPLLNRNAGSDFPTGGVFTHIWDYVAAKASDLGADIIFTGEGGNEVFSPGLALAYDQLRSGSLRAAVATIGRTRDSDRSGALTRLAQSPAQAILPHMLRGSSKHPTVTAWRGELSLVQNGASQRRNAQLRKLRSSGYSYTEIDSVLNLERSELFHAHSKLIPLPFFSPLLHPSVRRVVSSVAPKWRNPVKIGFQDKYLLRVVGRHVLPPEITEVRKIGISNQTAVALRGADIAAELSKVQVGAKWAGLDLSETFMYPHRLPVNTSLDWTRLLAVAAWATQGMDR